MLTNILDYRFIYLFNKNDIMKVKKEFYIVDNFVIKILIDINIIKSESIIFDIKKTL